MLIVEKKYEIAEAESGFRVNKVYKVVERGKIIYAKKQTAIDLQNKFNAEDYSDEIKEALLLEQAPKFKKGDKVVAREYPDEIMTICSEAPNLIWNEGSSCYMYQYATLNYDTYYEYELAGVKIEL